MIRLLIAALAILIFPVAARAQAENPETVPSGNTSWTGFQGGGFGGGSNLSDNFLEPGANQFFRTAFPTGFGCNTCTFSGTDSETPFGFGGKSWVGTFGLLFGYTHQFGNVVAGLEGDASVQPSGGASSALSVSQTATYTGTVTCTFISCPSITSQATRTQAFTGGSGQGSWQSTIRPRIGYLVTPSTLVYGTAGAAIGRVSGSFSYSATTPYCAGPGECLTDTTNGAANWSETRLGWAAGGGIEVAVARNLKLRVEYLHTDLGSFSENVPLVRSPVSNTGSTNALIDMKAASDAIRFGFAFNLN